MLKRIISKVIKRRYYWRDISFDQLSELYTSMMFRNLALSLVGIFIPIYLYELGFSLASIMTFYVAFFFTRSFADFLAGWLVARNGPKRTMFYSYLSYSVALAMFTSYSHFTWPLLLMAPVWGLSNSLFFISFHTSFSKVKHRKHGGKELSVLNIMERLGATLGPLVGGVIAVTFGAEYTFFAATAFFVLALIPLFLSKEPTKTGQRLNYHGLDLKRLSRDFGAHVALGVENTIHASIWPLFLSLVVFAGSAYMKIGALSSFAVVVSVVVAKVIGRMIDDRKGRSLLRTGAVLKSIINIVRLTVNSFGFAAVLNFIDELATISTRLPYTKSMYDRADELEGYRIVYIVSMEAFASLCKASTYAALTLIALSLPQYLFFCIAFGTASLASLLVMTERFPALDKRGVS